MPTLSFLFPKKRLPIFIMGLCLLRFAAGPAEGAEDWARVIGPRAWTFPKDHGAHPDYRTEWWYFTGNLNDDSGAPYGYQLTFFRQGLRFGVSSSGNAWDVRDLYLAHFAITEVSKSKFRFTERLSRAGPGLAGARTEGMDIWLLNWSARMQGSLITLEARGTDMELRLELTPAKPLVLHGQKGFSRKGSKEGQASYYSSFTDLKTKGFLRIGADAPSVTVMGKSWFDHEFGSNQLSPDQKGWDWFSLHFSDGRDLMIYFLRLVDGSLEPASSGTLVEPDGTVRHLQITDISVSVLKHWKSPRSGADYPGRWKIQIPSAGIDLLVTPLVSDQELNTGGSTGVIYWEGAVFGEGTLRGRKISCKGYVELTGYAGSLGGFF